MQGCNRERPIDAVKTLCVVTLGFWLEEFPGKLKSSGFSFSGIQFGLFGLSQKIYIPAQAGYCLTKIYVTMYDFFKLPKVSPPLITKNGDVVLTPYQCELTATKLSFLCGWYAMHMNHMDEDLKPGAINFAKVLMEVAEYFDYAADQSIETQRKWL